MKDEKETKQRLLASAKAEFLEKGYMSASLRNICRNAGVTTGAKIVFSGAVCSNQPDTGG